jgi:hypothetical protein
MRVIAKLCNKTNPVLCKPERKPFDLSIKIQSQPCSGTKRVSTPLLSCRCHDIVLQVTRASDGQSVSIGLLSPGGFANKSAHDAFCSKLDCVISNVFDQSPQKNHLGQRHKLVNASRHSVTVGPNKTPVYGMWFDPGVDLCTATHCPRTCRSPRQYPIHMRDAG